MKAILAELRAAVAATLALTLVCCGLYPLAVFALSQSLFKNQAAGSLLRDDGGAVIGSRLIGQPFSGEKFFHSRPSAAGTGYDATSSGGSNLGPTSQKLNDAIKDRVAEYRRRNGLKDSEPVPADAVTASASGLDPHISLRNAELQTERVAKARGLDVAAVRALVHAHTDPAGLGFLGEPGVNVLELNLGLEAKSRTR